MKYNSIYNKFSSGELSPYLKGRTDLEEYFSGVEEMTNFIPLKQGGTYFRPGTHFVGNSRTDNARIFSFSPADGLSYLVYLYPGLAPEVKKVEGDLLITCTLTSPSSVWSKYPDFTVAAGYFSPSSLEVAAVFDNLNFTSYGDLFVICDGTGQLAPIVAKRTGTTTFIIDSVLYPTLINPDTNVLWLDTSVKYPLRVPYQDPNIDANINLKPSGTTGSITITAQNAGATAINYFTGDPIGMMIKITQGTTTGVARVTGKVSDSVVNAATQGVNFGATTASNNFEISSFNAKNGYPKSACFHQGRLYFGGNITFPDTLWASLVGNIYHFMAKRFIQDATTNVSFMNYFGDIKTTDPFNFTLAATSANSIQWMYPSQTLIIGTTSTEYSITGGTDSILSVYNIEVSAISSHGSARVQPVKVGSSILFVSYDRKRLYEIPKDLRQYQSATELSIISEGILDKVFDLVTTNLNFYTVFGMQELAYQENEGLVWIRCFDTAYRKSALICLTMDRTSKTLGWSKHFFPYGTGYADISSISIVSDPSKGKRQFLYLYVYRSNYNVEKMWYRTRYNAMNQSNSFGIISSDKTVLHLDAASFVTAAIDSVFIGSRYGNGQNVSVISAQGNYLGEFLVSAGSITVPSAASYSPLLVGYKYTGQIETMPSESGAQFGVSQGSLRRTHEISIFIDRSRGGKYKSSLSPNEFPIDEAGTASALQTKEIKLSLNASPNDHQIILKQDLPYPMTILWLLTKGYTNDT